jgi:acyl-CoA dehydrogenase
MKHHAYVPRTTSYGLNPGDELNDLRMSDQVRPLFEHVKKFIRETVDPMLVEYTKHGEGKKDRWSFTQGQLDVLGKPRRRPRKKVFGTSSCQTAKPAKA